MLVRGGSAWPVQMSRVLGGLGDKLTVAVPLLHVRICQWLDSCDARVRVLMVFRGAAKTLKHRFEP